MADPLVSVVIPVHGGEPFLAETLAAVAAQTHPAVEVIVVDDGSPDASAEIAAAHPRVRLLRRAGQGVAAARNAGAAAATGELLAFLDQDDTWYPEKLERQVALLRDEPATDLALCHIDMGLDPGVPQPDWFPDAWLDRAQAGWIPSAWLVRRTALERVGPFDEEYAIACDSDWLARFKDLGLRSAMLEEPLLRWRVHGANGSYDRDTMQRELLVVLRRSAARQREAARAAEIGVVIPAYQAEAFLAEALDSVLALGVGDVVVVDDGSTDATAEIARAYAPRVRVVQQANGGIGAARNAGVARVRGDLLAFVDADDRWTGDALTTRLALLRARPEVDVVFGMVRTFSADGERGDPLPGHLPAGMLVRRASFDRVGPFATGTAVSEGLDWMLRAGEAGLCQATVAEQVLWRRVHADNNTFRHRGEIGEFARTLKASLDRRREAAGPA